MDEQISTPLYLPSALPPSLYDGPKRAFDLVASTIILIILTPILLITALAVKLTSRGPIFYKQTRIGRFNRPFKVWKFRTMKCDADRVGPLITSSDDDRITPLGGYLRRNKIDELPQLWNVMIGDMSLVGPRPQVPRFVAKFPEDQRTLIMGVRPGITGPTQLEFRHEERMLQGQEDREGYYITHLLPIKCDMDVHYVYSRSFILDLRVLATTATIVLLSLIRRIRHKNGYPGDEVTPVPIPVFSPIFTPDRNRTGKHPTPFIRNQDEDSGYHRTNAISHYRHLPFEEEPYQEEKQEEKQEEEQEEKQVK